MNKTMKRFLIACGFGDHLDNVTHGNPRVRRLFQEAARGHYRTQVRKHNAGVFWNKPERLRELNDQINLRADAEAEIKAGRISYEQAHIINERSRYVSGMWRFNINNLSQGAVLIYHGSTDCDHCSSDGVYLFPASARAWVKERDDFYNNLEGPGHIEVVRRENLSRFVDHYTPYHRDGIAEAHEDGHPHCVHGGW